MKGREWINTPPIRNLDATLLAWLVPCVRTCSLGDLLLATADSQHEWSKIHHSYRSRNLNRRVWYVSVLFEASAVRVDAQAGTMILLNVNTAKFIQIIAPLLAGVGLGMLFHAPYQIYADTLAPSDLTSATGAYFMIKFMGSTIGLVSLSYLY